MKATASGIEAGNGLVSRPHADMLATEQEVQERIAWLACLTVHAYGSDEEKPVFVALLRGALPFAAQFMQAITKADPNFHPELDTMTVSTYGTGRTPKQPEVVMGIDESKTTVLDRRVVVLDDMLDKGVTAAFVGEYFMQRGAAVVDLAALTIKQTERAACFETFPGEVIGCFDVPDVWVTGMGMDDNRIGHEGNRWMPYLAVAQEA